jgi:ubiquinone/menaquinone biosynthesis C-methylase UbiE
MSLWGEWIFPRLMDLSIRGNAELQALRTRALDASRGQVLELGFGTGLNLPHYPAAVQRIVAVDPSPGMAALARARMARASIDIEHHRITAEELPFDAASFDSVVCTLTLCSIPQVEAALAEVRRVLKPGGQFLFFEHGRHPDARISRWQDRLNPAWGRLFGGCNINRDVRLLVQGSGLTLTELDNPILNAAPAFVGYCYLGRAVRDS